MKLRPGSENTAFMVCFSVGVLSTLEHIYQTGSDMGFFSPFIPGRYLLVFGY